MRRALPFVAIATLLAGCTGGSGELSKKDDQELRNNFTRKLTPEEIAKLGGGPPKDAPKKEK